MRNAGFVCVNIKGFVQYILFPDCACWLCRRDAVLGDDHLCDACRPLLKPSPTPAAPPPLDGLTAGLAYEEHASALIHSFKYNGRIHLARLFAHAMSIPKEWQCDCLVPVPLHPLKLWLRGFNQSEELCRALQKNIPLPLRKDLLKRSRFTKTQTQLDHAARQTNVRDAFAAAPAAAGLSILLVDDVTTTHATLIACAKALKKAGATHVYAACACYAPASPA